MHTKSVKFRLTVWYFAAFFVSTAITFLAFYYVTQKILLQQTDREISLHSGQIEEVMAGENGTRPDAFPKDQLSHQFAEMPGMLVVIADGSGKILTMSQSVESGLPVITDTLEKSSGIIKPVFVNRNIGATAMRMGIFPVIKNETVASLVMVAHPVEVIKNSLTRLLEILAIVLLIVGVPAILGAYGLARGALRPVTELSLKLKRISSTNLHEPVANPKTGDELEELANSFNSLLKRLSGSFEREKQFIGDVAHELKTPLSTLKSTIEIGLSKKRENKEYTNILANTLVDINNLSSTVNDVLDLAWAESGEQTKSFEKVDLSGLVNDIYEVTEKMAEAKNIRVIKEIGNGINISGRRQKLFRALFNLADNAIKYTPANGKIAITLAAEDHTASIEISNSGPGIAKEDLLQIFNRFYRGSKKAKSIGSGLGLAICKSIIEAHGGKISAMSIPTKLTTFRIELSS